MLDNNDFTRLNLTTKMIKTIQKFQKLVENDLVVEELDEQVEEEMTIEHKIEPPTENKLPISLEKEIDVALIFSQTQNGREIHEMLAAGNRPSDKIITSITHIACDYLKSTYGVRPSTYYKETLARSLIKTYPVLASTASDIPHALWFHKNGRGDGRHAGKIHYRMESLAKQSDSRVFLRQRDAEQVPQTSGTTVVDKEEPNIDELVDELRCIVPTHQEKGKIEELWKKTIIQRNKARDEGFFLQYLKDFPVALAFDGQLISLDFQLLKPNAQCFDDAWNSILPKILDQYRDVHMYMKNDVIKALTVIRDKNPSRGAKRPREETQARKLNPLRGVIEWIDPEFEMPSTEIPMIFIAEKLFEIGDCCVAWKDITIPVGNDVLAAFKLLCQAFVVFNVKCSPSDKIFYSFFHAFCFKVEPLSTTSNKFVDKLN
ncbi:AAEL010194-PA [Aedes aegypti]|uniref:AAEL010194-PA n=1 Tax=Aedes aegypti TaxID=7159 RepID=Q16TL4_AEDAE|nr:AAEL010194-PA [Aedes aegypti]